MAANAFANAAAAVSAGYIKTVWDGGAVGDQAWSCVLSKWLAGATGEPGVESRALGQGATQAVAEANATANLNNFRTNRYGVDSTVVSKDSHGNNTHTKDTT